MKAQDFKYCSQTKTDTASLVSAHSHFLLRVPPFGWLSADSERHSPPADIRLHEGKKNNKRPLLPQHEMRAAVRLNSGWQTHNEGSNWNNISGPPCTSRSGIPAAIRPFSQIIPKRPANQNKTRGKEHNFTEQWLLMGHFWWRLQSAWRWALLRPLTWNRLPLWARFSWSHQRYRCNVTPTHMSCCCVWK